MAKTFDWQRFNFLMCRLNQAYNDGLWRSEWRIVEVRELLDELRHMWDEVARIHYEQHGH